MPRFLAVDYLQEALHNRREWLNNCLVAVPNHLEQIEVYFHKGILPDSAYRTPWDRAMCIKQGSAWRKEDLSKEFELLTAVYKDAPEPFPTQHDIAAGRTFDMVPSSNPESQDSVPDELLIQLSTLHHNYNGCENFEKENINELIKESRFFLEETGILHYFSEYSQNLPQLRDLLKRLKPKVVQDPLVADDGEDITEISFFRSHLIFDDGEQEKDWNKSENNHFIEKFHKHDDFNSNMLEENDIADLCNREDKQIQKINEEIQLDLDPVDLEKTTSDQDLANLVKCNETAKESQQLTTHMEILDSPTLKPETFPFKLSFSEADRFLQRAVLESPLEYAESSPPLLAMQSTKALNPFGLQPCFVMSPRKHQKLETHLWQHEKNFSNIVTLGLPEPLPEAVSYEMIHPTYPLKLLKLKPEEFVMAQELDLEWDPVSATNIQVNIALEDYDCQEDAEMWKKAPLTLEKTQINNSFETRKEDFPKIETGFAKNRTPSRHFQSKSKELFLNDDPVDNFMRLRGALVLPTSHSFTATGLVIDSKMNNESNSLREEKTKIAEKRNEKCFVKAIDSHAQTMNAAPVVGRKKRSKTTIAQVELSESYSKLISAIEASAEPMLSLLQQRGMIPSTQEFSSLSADVTKFIVKQHEKAQRDSQQKGDTDVYKSVMALHCLVCAGHLLINGSLPSALIYLSNIQNKHEHVLSDSLEDIRQQLFQAHCYLKEKKLAHPKIQRLCDSLAEYILKKRLRSPEHDPKILIISKRDIHSLLQCIKDALCQMNGIIPVVPADSQLSTHQILTLLDNHNCLLLCARHIGEDFPWAQFSYVADYEYCEPSAWRELCERQNIRFLALQIVQHKRKLTKIDIHDSHTKTDAGKSEAKPLLLIGSEGVTSRERLLHDLEAKHNIIIAERYFGKLSQISGNHYADIIIDDRTCVVFQDIITVKEDVQLQALVEKIVSLSLKYVVCWLFMCSSQDDESQKRYPYAENAVCSIAKLQTVLAQFSKQSDDYTVKLIFSKGEMESADLIREICDLSLRSAAGSTNDQEPMCNLLNKEITKHEQMLLELPCLNSVSTARNSHTLAYISAQMLLAVGPLKEVMTLPTDELVVKCSSLSKKILKRLHELLHRTPGLIVDSTTDQPSSSDGPTDKHSVKTSTGGIENMETVSKNYPQNRKYLSDDWTESKSTDNEVNDSFKGNSLKSARKNKNACLQNVKGSFDLSNEKADENDLPYCDEKINLRGNHKSYGETDNTPLKVIKEKIDCEVSNACSIRDSELDAMENSWKKKFRELQKGRNTFHSTKSTDSDLLDVTNHSVVFRSDTDNSYLNNKTKLNQLNPPQSLTAPAQLFGSRYSEFTDNNEENGDQLQTSRSNTESQTKQPNPGFDERNRVIYENVPGHKSLTRDKDNFRFSPTRFAEQSSFLEVTFPRPDSMPHPTLEVDQEFEKQNRIKHLRDFDHRKYFPASTTVPRSLQSTQFRFQQRNKSEPNIMPNRNKKSETVSSKLKREQYPEAVTQQANQRISGFGKAHAQELRSCSPCQQSRIPAIAPVTPVRRPMQALTLGFENRSDQKAGQNKSVTADLSGEQQKGFSVSYHTFSRDLERIQKWPAASRHLQRNPQSDFRTPFSGVPEPESPPMDLDSDDDGLNHGTQMKPLSLPENVLSSKSQSQHLRIEKCRPTRERSLESLTDFHVGLWERVQLSPLKKRKLTYEKVPGNKGGQTRLSFL